MRKFFRLIILLLLVPGGYIALESYSHADLSTLPALESGDLIFQTALDRHLALPIMVATGSIYTHVGIIHKQKDGYTVIHAAGPVIENSLGDFIAGGWGEKFTLLRYPGLSQQQREAMVKDARTYLGRPYNGIFYMKSKDIYCSELPYLVFQSEHVPLGRLQKMGDLYMNNPAVHEVFKARWHMHPLCQTPGMDYDACWKAVLEEPIITPVSLARDPGLTQIYSNYLF
jgi:hypothetical protein